MTTVTDLSCFLCVCAILPFGSCFVLGMVMDWRYNSRRLIGVFAGLCFFHAAICTIIYYRVGSTHGSRTFIGLFLIIIWFGIFWLCSRHRDGRACFTLIIVQLLSCIVSVLCSIVVPYGSFAWLICWGVSTVVISILLWFFFRIRFCRLLQSTNIQWMKMCIMPLTMELSMSILIVEPSLSMGYVQNKSGALLLCTTSVLVYTLLYKVLTTLQKQHDAQHDVALLRTQIHALEQQSERMVELDQKTRVFRHDQRHFIQLLSGNAAAGNLDGIQQILSGMNKELDILTEESMKAYTGVPLIDTVLSMCAQRARNQDTRFTAAMALPEQMSADITELAVVISNALENALKACSRIPEGLPREIILKGRKKSGQFFLSIENTYHGEILLSPQTGYPITLQEGHGYGTDSIATFAEKNQGTLQYQVDERYFRLYLLF